MFRILSAALTALIISALVPAASHAGVAGASGLSPAVIYSADPGETNDVTVSRRGNDIVISDSGATIVPRRGCVRVTPGQVRCEGIDLVAVNAGDGNDRVALLGDLNPAAQFASIDGEQGDDEITATGTPSTNYLAGGAGRDVLRGGPRTRGFTAADLLGFGPLASQATVLVEPDRVICATPVGSEPVGVQADRTDTIEGPCPRPNILAAYEPKPEPAKRPGRCKRRSTARGARRITRTRSGVVFSTRSGVYACLYSRGRVTRLLDEGAGVNRRPKPQLKGRYVAYTSRGSAIGDEFDRVIVWDLRQARVNLGAVSTVVSDIALKSNGSVAWIARAPFPDQNGGALYEVRRTSNAQRQDDELLDRGTGIGPKSLALWRNGRTISWREDGRRRTATLP